MSFEKEFEDQFRYIHGLESGGSIVDCISKRFPEDLENFENLMRKYNDGLYWFRRGANFVEFSLREYDES